MLLGDSVIGDDWDISSGFKSPESLDETQNEISIK